MADGLWAGAGATEPLRQDITRHRILAVELGTGAVVNPPPATGNNLVSSYNAALSPNNVAFLPPIGAVFSQEGGPHFVMSPETPDSAQTFGVQIALFSASVAGAGTIPVNSLATAIAPGFTLTLWCLIANTMSANGLGQPIWASLNPLAGVNFNELYHSFDINAAAIRVQIGNGTSVTGGADTGAIMIAMAEL